MSTLAEAFTAARLAAEQAQPGDDGGTANFDSAFLYARRGLTKAAVEKAAAEAEITVRRHDRRWWKGWFVEVDHGQGAWDAGVYYQID